MTLLKALATVIGTAVGFGVAGLGIGALLGKIAPSFFRYVLPWGRNEEFNPVELGIGFGLVNGLIWGMVIGTLIVAIVSWRETRLGRKDRDASTS